MKKSFIAILILFSIITSCDKDDFCTLNPITPNLVLEFYDKSNVDELKNVTHFSVIAQGKTDSLFMNRSENSISIPLNTNAKETVYILKRNETETGTLADNEIATLTIKYDTEDDFVSRSCGFRVIFNNVSFEKTGWIDRLSVDQVESIKTQDNAHVNIFH